MHNVHVSACGEEREHTLQISPAPEKTLLAILKKVSICIFIFSKLGQKCDTLF